jgi:2-amino-4-hydroxy-6-hydroxymethyldihydropteridine diphosphokinase
MSQALIALGSNEPSPAGLNPPPLSASSSPLPPAFRELAANLDRAVARLSATPGIRVLARSCWHVTAAAGGPAGQPTFLNGAVTIETAHCPWALLDLLLDIERDGGRQRQCHWGPRPIDLDLLLYDGCVLDTPRLAVPHPRLGYRRFVLEPAAEVAADWLHPLIGWTIGQLARHIAAPLNLVPVLGRDRSTITASLRRLPARPGTGRPENRDRFPPKHNGERTRIRN